MKTTLILAALALSMQSLAFAGLPEGNFSGKALWKTQKETGKYEVSTEIKGGSISSTYTLPDGSVKNWNFEMQPTANGFFSVVSGKRTLGQGYCLEHVSLCHYEINFGETTLEESLTVENEKLYKYGSKKEKGILIMWQEALSK